MRRACPASPTRVGGGGAAVGGRRRGRLYHPRGNPQRPPAQCADTARAAEPATRTARLAPLERRARFAADRSLRVPAEPLAHLWHAATLLREHRGDGHVAALVAAGVAGREAHVLHAIASGIPRGVCTPARDFDEAEWTSRRGALEGRGLLEGDRLSGWGRQLMADIKERTDQRPPPPTRR
ncbi:hypothetical protein ACFYOV_28485 [Streptomyces sp. NPDC005931]|uniref:SCO6745 family protein n=1 Tax=Streptomyces sp. NPDC005931 TaxID=3364737 RepID=UPI003696C152